MFTGIIEEVGRVEKLLIKGNSGQIFIQAKKVLEGTHIGDSISVNGVCLTVVKISGNGFVADIMAQTARKSNLGRLKPGDKVDLERAMEVGERFGGHIVTGHIDGTGTIISKRSEENAVWVKISAEKELLRLIVSKGSIAIDGISLTVAEITESDFSVSLIPHTLKETVLLDKKAGDEVNLENDIVGKYVDKLLFSKKTENENKDSRLTMELLEEYGI